MSTVFFKRLERGAAPKGEEEQRSERALTQKSQSKRYAACSDVVEESGFEPLKAKPADLQSVPFGHLGTPPCSVLEKVELVDGFEPPTC